MVSPYEGGGVGFGEELGGGRFVDDVFADHGGGEEDIDEAVHDGSGGVVLVGEWLFGTDGMVEPGGGLERDMGTVAGGDEGKDRLDGGDGFGRNAAEADLGAGVFPGEGGDHAARVGAGRDLEVGGDVTGNDLEGFVEVVRVLDTHFEGVDLGEPVVLAGVVLVEGIDGG